MSSLAKVTIGAPVAEVRSGATRHLRPAVARAEQAPPTDHQLLGRCLAGDEQAWEEIVGRYERLVFSVALKNGLSREDAADVTQLTFVDVVEASSASDEDYDRLAAVHAGLARLGERCRELLYALFFDPDAPSYAVVAERLRCAVGTIGPQRARCLHRLRMLLDEEETAA